MARSQVAVEDFVAELAALKFENVFNPYSDTCATSDLPDAAGIRRRNLATVLQAALETGVDSIWVARDLGYRGGRRTGLAMTDDVHLDAHGELFNVRGLVRPTAGPTVAERTATVIWQTLRDIGRPIFLWNVFPLHPHEPTDPMSNRKHTRAERDASRDFLVWLVDRLAPEKIVAVGRDAQDAASELGFSAFEVRHPSYGGQREFVSTLHERYSVVARAEPDLFGFSHS